MSSVQNGLLVHNVIHIVRKSFHVHNFIPFYAKMMLVTGANGVSHTRREDVTLARCFLMANERCSLKNDLHTGYSVSISIFRFVSPPAQNIPRRSVPPFAGLPDLALQVWPVSQNQSVGPANTEV